VSIEEALEACDKCAFDCAIVDYRMPRHDGLHGIAALHERLPYMSIIMATGQGDEMVATEAMKLGASDYIPKTLLHAETIRRIIESAVEKSVLQRKLAEQREELANFASMLVHDLKAPINSIQTFAGLIEGDLRRVVGAGRSMGALIDSLYQCTKADAVAPFEPVEMGRVVEDALGSLGHMIRERGARVTYGELPAVTGNAPHLTQLLQNLIGNAIKYCEAVPPTVHIAASPDRENGWLFTVTDNGIGIAEASYQQIFEPFNRLHVDGKYEGTGLGLATCKKIVERHGGVIRCESKVGEGTTFFFTLPNCRKAPLHASVNSDSVAARQAPVGG
jgi:signal transduction histidine kinase